ncbi:MAG: 50S ribosomal protein L28 [bacterium]|nr:50S ribosomal protein L28 [bacterium]
MSRVCSVTGKRAMSGNNVSHSQRHTRRKWQPNLIQVTLVDKFGRKKRVKMCAKALRTLNRSPKN